MRIANGGTDIPLAVGRFARWNSQTMTWDVYDTDGGYSVHAEIEPFDDAGKVGVLRHYHCQDYVDRLRTEVVAGLSPDQLEHMDLGDLIPPAYMIAGKPNDVADARLGVYSI